MWSQFWAATSHVQNNSGGLILRFQWYNSILNRSFLLIFRLLFFCINKVRVSFPHLCFSVISGQVSQMSHPKLPWFLKQLLEERVWCLRYCVAGSLTRSYCFRVPKQKRKRPILSFNLDIPFGSAQCHWQAIGTSIFAKISKTKHRVLCWGLCWYHFN